MKTRQLIISLALAAGATGAQAGAPDTEVVEFYNLGIRHYFVTASARDVRLVEEGAAGPGWVKTGRTFQAWTDAAQAPAGAVPVCRFYSPLANSHFFTGKASECEFLKSLEAKERATTANPVGWLYEGVGFHIEIPQDGQCPAGTVALQRFYNHGYETGEGGNHRFVDDSGAVELMHQSGWNPEGTAFCARTKSTGTQANLPATTTSFETLTGTWRGTGKFEVETKNPNQVGNLVETESRHPLEITIDATGAISGTGAGCTFTGQATSGDGFRSLFMGHVTATGCTDPAFNGEFPRVKLERFGTATLKLRFQRETGNDEVSIDATLATDTPTAPPPTTPPTASLDLVDGDWVGTLRWEAETGNTETQANHALNLSISTSGALSGAGFGCTVTGQLVAGVGRKFSGSATFAGCENAAFNGTYRDVRVQSEGSSRIEARFKREEGNVEAEIEGTLDLQGTTTTPNPPPNPNPNPNPPASSSIVGAWAGAVSWQGGGVRASDTLTLTVGEDGTVSGGGRGCTFAGILTLDRSKHEAKGTVTASGCTDAAFNGTYRDAKLEAEDGDRLEVELEREGGGVEVKIKGAIARA